MAHDSWAISAFHGEAQNQPGRITRRPDVVIGDFDRVGGIGPLPYMYAPAALNETELGYDWLGISAARVNAIGSNTLVIRDAQSGGVGSFTATAWASAPFRFYVPGGGIYAIDGHAGSTTDVYVSESAVVLQNGTLYHSLEWGSAWEPNISVVSSSSSTLPANVTLVVVLVYFRQAAHGLVPVAIKWDSAETTSAGQAFHIQCPAGALPDGFVVHEYMQLIPYAAGNNWHRYYAGNKRGCRPHYVNKPEDVPVDAKITFYGANTASQSASQYTVADGRAFYIVSATDTAFGISPASDSSGNMHLILEQIVPTLDQKYGRQYVFFTDPGHLAFSDGKSSPQVLRFDDRIRAITASVRGIYAFSEVGLWEAYGDFTTAANTRISLVPVLGGVDDDGPKVTFSGDTAYFVKEGIVHSIGPGGVQQVGRPIFLNRPHEISSIWYDRFSRRLLALFYDTVAVYDPNTRNWSRWPFTIPVYNPHRVLFNIAADDWWVDGYEVIATVAPPVGGTYPQIEVEFRKLDFALPDLRKRLHVITMAYDGQYQDVTVEIRPDGTGPWLPCNVLDEGGYFQARCPTPTFKHLDVRVAVNTGDKNFALNPPLVFTFTKRGRKYHAR